MPALDTYDFYIRKIHIFAVLLYNACIRIKRSSEYIIQARTISDLQLATPCLTTSKLTTKNLQKLLLGPGQHMEYVLPLCCSAVCVRFSHQGCEVILVFILMLAIQSPNTFASKIDYTMVERELVFT